MSPIYVAGVSTSPSVAITAPVAGVYLDLSTITVSWAYSSPVADTQFWWALRRKVSGSSTYTYWNGTTWQSTVCTFASSTNTHTFSAGQWPNGVIYNFSVQVGDSHGVSAWTPDQILVGQLAPTITVSAPSGSIATSVPTIQWTTSIPKGAIQTFYRIIILDAAGYASITGGDPTTATAMIYDSGLTAGQATSQVCGTVLSNSTSYYGYIQVTETGGEVSTWTTFTFTPSYTAPATPTFVPTASLGADTAAVPGPIATLVVTDNQISLIAGATTTLAISSSDDLGTSWWPVRGAGAIPITVAGQVVTVVDCEASPGFVTQYKARVTAVSATGNVLASNAVNVTATHPSPQNWWLKDPLVPKRNMKVSLADKLFASTTTDRQTVIWCVGRPDPVILSDVASLPNLSCVFVFLTEASYQNFEALRASQHALLFQGPVPMGQWYVRIGAAKGDSTDLASVRATGAAGQVIRRVNVTMQAVAAP